MQKTRWTTRAAAMLIALTVAMTALAINTEEAEAAEKKPSRVRITKVKGINDRSIKLSWKRARNAKKYEVYRAKSKTGKFKKIRTVKKRSIINRRLKNGKVYYYKVRAVNGKEKGKFSAVKAVRAGVKMTGISFDEGENKGLLLGSQTELWVKYEPENAVHGREIWKSSNPEVAEVDKGGLITAKSVGTATITVKVDGKTARQKVTVVDPNAPRYTYDVKFLNKPYGNGLSTIMYVKTNAPDSSFSINLYDMNGKRVSKSIGRSPSYDDLVLETDSSMNGFYAAKGGFIGIFAIKGTGKMKVRVTEYIKVDGKMIWDPQKGGYAKAVIDMGTIDVGDYEAEKKAWMQSVVDKVTTDEMTKPEKMEAITQYMYDNSLYSKTSKEKGGYIRLAADEGVPFWKNAKYEFNSYSSPYLLVDFGELIDYPLVSLYEKYKMGTEEWKQWHYYAQSVEDDSYYYFCHSEDNQIEESAIKQIDLSTWPFYECTR